MCKEFNYIIKRKKPANQISKDLTLLELGKKIRSESAVNFFKNKLSNEENTDFDQQDHNYCKCYTCTYSIKKNHLKSVEKFEIFNNNGYTLNATFKSWYFFQDQSKDVPVSHEFEVGGSESQVLAEVTENQEQDSENERDHCDNPANSSCLKSKNTENKLGKYYI